MRLTYKTALRVKGFRPLPAPTKLRSSISTPGITIDATASAKAEREAA